MQNKGAGILITDYIKTLGDRSRILKMKTYQILKELMFLAKVLLMGFVFDLISLFVF